MSKILDLNQRLKNKKQDSLLEHERVEECYWHSMFYEGQDCRYCQYRKQTASMLLKIMFQDMLSTTKNKNLGLTNVDAEMIALELVELVRDFSTKITEERLGKATEQKQSSREESTRELQETSRRKSKIKKRIESSKEGSKSETTSENGRSGDDESGRDV